jgi:hypothetical protein
MNWREYAFAMLGFSASACCHLRHRAAAGASCPGTRRASPPSARPGLEHRRQLHHQHQLAVLHARDHHELSHPDGRPRYHNFFSRGGRHRRRHRAHPRHQAHHSATIGNFWVDMTRTLLYVLLPGSPSSTRCCWSARASRRTCTPTPSRTRSRNPARRRPSPRARSPRRKPSRCWAPTAAASSTPTAPTL